MPGPARWQALRELALSSLQTIHDEMEAYGGDRSKAWQESRSGMAFREKTDAIKRVLSDLEASR